VLMCLYTVFRDKVCSEQSWSAVSNCKYTDYLVIVCQLKMMRACVCVCVCWGGGGLPDLCNISMQRDIFCNIMKLHLVSNQLSENCLNLKLQYSYSLQSFFGW
jgi:hypothetical protein